MSTVAAWRSAGAPLTIGLTFDLREEYLAEGYSEEETAELDSPRTIAAIEEALLALGHRPVRVGHARRLMERLLAGERWDLVFNIAEGLYGYGREALVPALLDHYQVPYTFSDPLVMALTLNKATTKRVARDAGVPTPDFVVIERPAEARDVRLPLPLFAKPIAEGTSKGIGPSSILRRREDIEPVCRDLLDRFRQPVLLEGLLPGRELTVGVLGEGEGARALGVLEVLLQPGADAGVYSYRNKEHFETLVDYRLADPEGDPEVAAAVEVALAAWRALGCRDAGRVDLRSTADGQPQLIEINPLAGLHPERSDLPILCARSGMPYGELIGAIVEAARRRLSAPAPSLACAS